MEPLSFCIWIIFIHFIYQGVRVAVETEAEKKKSAFSTGRGRRLANMKQDAAQKSSQVCQVTLDNSIDIFGISILMITTHNHAYCDGSFL